jgi:uncharacterized protein (DUF433 family)
MMADDSRITTDPSIMGGKPCIRGMRVTVDTIVGLLSSGDSREVILQAYPYLDNEDITAALEYADEHTAHDPQSPPSP